MAAYRFKAPHQHIAIVACRNIGAHYVRRPGVISPERAITQMSAVAANEIMAYDRGRIAEGLAADLVVFDFARMEDKSTFADPTAVSAGVIYVLVNGQVVLESGRFTGAKPGKVLRGPGYRAPGR